MFGTTLNSSPANSLGAISSGATMFGTGGMPVPGITNNPLLQMVGDPVYMGSGTKMGAAPAAAATNSYKPTNLKPLVLPDWYYSMMKPGASAMPAAAPSASRANYANASQYLRDYISKLAGR